MLTDYERYQLEWMIEHGHSLKEFVQGLDLVDLDGIDGLEDAYAIWEQDYGFGGEIFSNEREFNEEDAPALAAAESAPVSYQQAIAAALRKDGWSVIDDSPSPLLIISRESPTTGRTFSVTVSAKGDPDNPLTWLNGFKKLTEEDALIRWKGGRDSYSTLLIGQDITHFKDGDVAAAVALVAETLGEVIRREGGVTLRDWYMQAYPEDPLGSKINPVVTFDDALSAVPTGGSFYDSIGIADSVARERIFEELCNRYGYTYDDVYDSWLNESPLPSPAISQQPEKIAVAAGYRFNLVDAREASGIDLKDCGTVVTVNGHDYNVMKGATYEDSRKVDDLLDSHGDKPISDFRKQPQGMSLKQAAMEAREASAKLFDKNVGADSPTRRDER